MQMNPAHSVLTHSRSQVCTLPCGSHLLRKAPTPASLRLSTSSSYLSRHHTCQAFGPGQTPVVQLQPESIDLRKLTGLITSQPLDDEQLFSLQQLATALDVPLGTAKALAFKRKGVLELSSDEVRERLERIAEIVQVPLESARKMAVIQPGLLLETEKQASALAAGIQTICYELGAPKDEVVQLILENQSVLHGRQMHLSVADIAHLAMLREPRGRIVG